tara:strand:+ start:1893 stop:2402 length:510 start_codon:yes stop_codon:yes gene_type:complete
VSRLVLGIDPGPEFCGVALYDLDEKRVVFSSKNMTVAEVLLFISSGVGGNGAQAPEAVVIERVQSYGIAGSSLLRTSEVVGRLWERAESEGKVPLLLYRRDVLRVLDVTGKGNRDALVRERLIEMHGGDRKAAQGTKKDQGPLYGVAGHAWQALGVAIAGVAVLWEDER